MSIIVHRNEQIDEALRRLHAESIRENIFEVVNKKRYNVKPSEERHEVKKEWKKRKRRSRRAKRKMKK